MAAKTDSRYSPLFASLLLVVFMAAALPGFAQDEPTPVPEPAQEEPTPVPVAAEEEPAAETEAAAPAAPAEEAAAAEAAEPAPEPEIKEAGVPVVYRDKTRITIDGRAEMNGYIELIVQPNNEDPTKVRTNVVAKTKPKKITKAMVEQLIFGLGERYKVKQTGDKTILIKRKNKKVPPVAISIKTQNLAGVAVMIGQG